MLKALTTEAEVEALITAAQPTWLLKHSSTCSISSSAHDEVEAFLARHPEATAGIIVVQAQRPLSAWVAQRLVRVHQSPQLFLFQNGGVRWSASHWSITAAAMEQALAQAPSPAGGR